PTGRARPPAASKTTVPPTSTTTEAAGPLARLAGSCAAVPAGSVAPFLVVGKVGSGTAPDPRTSLSTRWVGIGFSQSIGATLQSAAPYSVTAVLLPTGATAPTKGVPIDRAGTVQLWIFWDGSA